MKPDLKSWVTRLRHRRGFGVHSPLAYRIVKEILWPSREYAYYAETQIVRSSDSEIRIPLLRAYRLAAMMRLPMEIQGDLNPELQNLFASRKLEHSPCLRLLLDRKLREPDEYRQLLDKEGVLFVHHGIRPSQPENLPGELIFLLSDGWIAISRPGVPRNCYEF